MFYIGNPGLFMSPYTWYNHLKGCVMMKIGFIGGGIMGLPMALNLKKGGYDVTLYNRTYEKIKPYEDQIQVVKTLDELVKDKDIIFTIVGYPSEVEALYFELFKKVKPGAILVDMTTSSPKLAKRLYLEGKKHQLKLLDSPVTGGDKGAINGTLSIMVGGDETAFNLVLPLLKTMGKTITYMGESSSGQTMKLANQIVIASNIVGIAEAITFAKDHHLDLNKALDVINGGSAQSWQAQNNGPKMVLMDYKPGFYIKHFIKDLRLAIDEMGTTLPNLIQVEALYTKLNQMDLGTQAIIEAYIQN